MGEMPAYAEAGLRVERAADVVTVTLNRPERHNAQTPAMWAALTSLGSSLPGDVRFVVFRGAGSSFSSGLDTASYADLQRPQPSGGMPLAALPETELNAVLAAYQSAFTWCARPDIITIAAVQGHAIGAGFQLALACDIRIAATDVQFAMPEATLGLVPDLGGTSPLVRTVGYARALELCLTGRRLGAVEAAALGLVNLVVPAAELVDAVADCVSALRATNRTTSSELKALLLGALSQPAQQQLASERNAQARRLKDAAQEGD